jgi:hypothetical protein
MCHYTTVWITESRYKERSGLSRAPVNEFGFLTKDDWTRTEVLVCPCDLLVTNTPDGFNYISAVLRWPWFWWPHSGFCI